MNTYHTHLLNASTLIIMGGWWYYDTNVKASFLPILIGVMLLSITNGVRFQGKAVTRVAFVFTIIGFGVLLAKPIPMTFETSDLLFKFRIWTMTITSCLATCFFIWSMILNFSKSNTK